MVAEIALFLVVSLIVFVLIEWFLQLGEGDDDDR
jgi:hypothetical protein